MPPGKKRKAQEKPPSIRSISVSGFKSIATEQTIEIRPLTLLAGVNSSGKSSMMQAILLLKQTLEASYDPGPLMLNGPNVRFTLADQLLFHGEGGGEASELVIRMEVASRRSAELVFRRGDERRLEIVRCTFAEPDGKPRILTLDSPVLNTTASLFSGRITPEMLDLPRDSEICIRVIRDRCFLVTAIVVCSGVRQLASYPTFDAALHIKILEDVIHIPGLRGAPERAYPVTAIGPRFPGTFENYTAGIVAGWSTTSQEKLKELGRDLSTLGLTWKVEAKTLDDTRVELRVGRLRNPRRGGASDLVNIADVGFGVSQTLPVLVALLTAQPGQLVYIEQPEIHLHPSAQVAMASLLAKAANRGVHVVAETHSSLLLLGVQSQVAEKKIEPDKVKLHWFNRDETTGTTTVTSADLDEAGRFGDWPEDFDETSLKAQAHYLDAAESVLARE